MPKKHYYWVKTLQCDLLGTSCELAENVPIGFSINVEKNFCLGCEYYKEAIKNKKERRDK